MIIRSINKHFLAGKDIKCLEYAEISKVKKIYIYILISVNLKHITDRFKDKLFYLFIY